MKRASVAKLCYVLLVACIPASMLCVLWLPPAVQGWLEAEHHGVYMFLFHHVYLVMPSWLQYFALQTLVAVIAICAACYWVGRHGWLRLPSLNRRHLFIGLVGAYALWSALTYIWSDWPYATRAYVIRELPFYFSAWRRRSCAGARSAG